MIILCDNYYSRSGRTSAAAERAVAASMPDLLMHVGLFDISTGETEIRPRTARNHGLYLTYLNIVCYKYYINPGKKYDEGQIQPLMAQLHSLYNLLIFAVWRAIARRDA